MSLVDPSKKVVAEVPNGMNGEEEDDEEKYQYNYYGYYTGNKSRWWRILCLNSAKEAKEKDSDVRDLWNTQVCFGFN